MSAAPRAPIGIRGQHGRSGRGGRRSTRSVLLVFLLNGLRLRLRFYSARSALLRAGLRKRSIQPLKQGEWGYGFIEADLCRPCRGFVLL